MMKFLIDGTPDRFDPMIFQIKEAVELNGR